MKKQYLLTTLATFTLVLLSCDKKDPSSEVLKQKNTQSSNADSSVANSLHSDLSISDMQEMLIQIAEGKDTFKVVESLESLIDSINISLSEVDESELNEKVQLMTSDGLPSQQFLVELGNGDLFTFENEKDVRLVSGFAFGLAQVRPDVLQDILKKNSKNKLRPSDFPIYLAALEGAMEYSENWRRAGYTELISLAESNNPIYRLLAAQAVSMIESDSKQLVSFYEQYSKEGNLAVRQAVIRGLSSLESTAALELLEKIPVVSSEDKVDGGFYEAGL